MQPYNCKHIGEILSKQMKPEKYPLTGLSVAAALKKVRSAPFLTKENCHPTCKDKEGTIPGSIYTCADWGGDSNGNGIVDCYSIEQAYWTNTTGWTKEEMAKIHTHCPLTCKMCPVALKGEPATSSQARVGSVAAAQAAHDWLGRPPPAPPRSPPQTYSYMYGYFFG